MPDTPYPGNRAITLDWLARQLQRLAQFTLPSPINPSADFIQKQIEQFSLTDEITAQQSRLSSLTASIIGNRAKNFEAKARLNRQAFSADIKNNTYEILLSGRTAESASDVWTVKETSGGRKVVTLPRSPLAQELIYQWNEYLDEERVHLKVGRAELAKMIDEDDKVRKEEQELRESNKVSKKDYANIEEYAKKLKIATEIYLSTRYSLKQTEKIKDASVRIVKERTAGFLAEIHKNADKKRIETEKESKKQNMVEKKLMAAEDLESGRLKAKVESLEELCEREKDKIRKERDDFKERKETAKRFCKAVMDACEDDEFKQVEMVVKDIRGVVRKLEDTAIRVRAAARNDQLGFRE
jgi:hypothetical protein